MRVGRGARRSPGCTHDAPPHGGALAPRTHLDLPRRTVVGTIVRLLAVLPGRDDMNTHSPKAPAPSMTAEVRAVAPAFVGGRLGRMRQWSRW